jgi:hypothetical protein
VDQIKVWVHNAIFNNILAMLWQSVVWMEKSGVPGDIHQTVVTPPPPKIGKNMIFWRKIVIFQTNYNNIAKILLKMALCTHTLI